MAGNFELLGRSISIPILIAAIGILLAFVRLLRVGSRGGVAGYYSQFGKVVVPILNEDPGCDGFFIAPLIENVHDQLLLINWKSVDAHHEDFEKKPTFKACIDALKEYYKIFVVPWHIVGLYLSCSM